MKILAKFFLSGVFVFLPAVCFAQGGFGLDKDCGFPPALKTLTAVPHLMPWASAKQLVDGVNNLEYGVDMLIDGQNCLNANLIGLRTSVETIHTQMGWNADSNHGFRDDIADLQDKLKQTELNLHTAETKIETLEDRLRTAEEALQLLQLRASMPPRPARSPKATVSKPKAPVNKPTQQTAPKGNP